MQPPVEQDAVPGRAQPVAELDVLDARPIEPLIEPANRVKRPRAHGAQSRPERKRLVPRRLMRVRVQQVAVLRQRRLRPRHRVIGTKDGIDVRVGRQEHGDPHDGIRPDDDVGVDEEQDLASRCGRAVVACGGRAAAAGGRDHAGAALRRNRCTVLHGTIGDDDQLGRLRRRERMKAFHELSEPLVERDDDADCRQADGRHGVTPSLAQRA